MAAMLGAVLADVLVSLPRELGIADDRNVVAVRAVQKIEARRMVGN